MPFLQLAYPVKPLRFNQKFGENPATYARFGIKGHNGNDLYAVHGQPIYAAHDGYAFYEVDDDQGHGVVLITDRPYTYKGQQAYFKTIYWHMCDSAKEPHYKSPVEDTPLGSKGYKVYKGDLIGFADNTGYSTGDHLHFGLKPLAPSSARSDDGAGNFTNIEQSNGYAGAIDPAPYYTGQVANTQKEFLFDMGIYTINSDVLELQKRLKVPPALGFFGVGIFGPQTFQAVKAFQSKYSIPSTGFVGPMTRAALNRGWPI